MPTPGTILITLVGLTTSIGCYLADWNHTHIHNPRWPPHAKFHNGQTMSMGLLLGLTSLYYLYRSPVASRFAGPMDLQRRKSDLNTAVWIASLYWTTQLSAFFYPGSLPMDPEFGVGGEQVYICLTMFGMLGTGLWLERRALGEVGEGGKRD